MSEAFYEGIKTTFDADGTLVSTFGALYTGEPPDPTDKNMPFCVLMPAEESKVGGSFSSKYHEESFSFHIVAATLGVLGGYVAAIDDVFDDTPTAFAVTGLQIMLLEKRTAHFSEGDFFWEAVVQYVTRYRIAR